MKIGIVGLGYVGLEVANSFAEEGCSVIGVDCDSEKVKKINMGLSPIENVSNLRLSQNLKSRNLFVIDKYENLDECSAVIYCVPTPLTAKKEPDLSFLVSALQSSAPHFSKGTLIVNESTSFPGTLRNLVPKEIASVNPRIVDELDFAVSPERVSPGNAVPLRSITRVVSGLSPNAKKRVQELYELICDDVRLVDSPEIAEMSKLLENTFRQINISFINEFNIICRKLGIDTRQVVEAANSKPFGFMKFDPGPGIGGHCIPVDPLYLQDTARKIGVESAFIELATQYNEIHIENLIDLIEHSLAPRKLQGVLILGVAYKSGLSDVRETPAQRLVDVLSERGIKSGWIDHLVTSWNGKAPSGVNEGWSAAIIHTAQSNLPIDELSNLNIPIFDLTGEYLSDTRIWQV